MLPCCGAYGSGEVFGVGNVAVWLLSGDKQTSFGQAKIDAIDPDGHCGVQGLS